MMDEKKRKKLGLSLKTSKKLVIGDKEEFKSMSGLQTQNVKNLEFQLKVNHVSSPVCEPSAPYRCESSSTIDRKVGITDSERLLWKNIFPSAETLTTWEDLEDLPNTVVSSSPKKDRTTITNSEITNLDGINGNLNGFNENYIDLPKSCIICCTRKRVQLIHPGNFQQTEKKTLLPQIKKNVSKAANKNIDKEIPRISSSLGDDNKMHNVGGSINEANQIQHHQQQNFILGSQPGSIDKKENMTRMSMPNNVVLDLTNDYLEHKSDGLHNCWKEDENISKNSHQMLNSCLKLINKIPCCIKGTASKEELKCCPMCQLQFCHRSKQEIDNHISSCIGDEVIINDDSDEDW